MKAEIIEAVYDHEFQYQGRTYHEYRIVFVDEKLDRITAKFVSTKLDQNYFVAGKECEFQLIEAKDKKGKEYYKVKRPDIGGNPNYQRAKKQEQSKYSGFSASYIKDMIIHKILEPEFILRVEDGIYMEDDPEAIAKNDIVMLTWRKRSKEIFDHLVKLDSEV